MDKDAVRKILHAGLLALRLEGLWLGALVEGPSGAGKSDLALRALDRGFRLVADDRVVVFASGGALFGRAPKPLAGLIEVRGLGVTALASLPYCRIGLRVRLVDDEVERLPEPAMEPLLGLALPAAPLRPFEASAPARLALLLEHLGARALRRYQAPFAPPGGRVGG